MNVGTQWESEQLSSLPFTIFFSFYFRFSFFFVVAMGISICNWMYVILKELSRVTIDLYILVFLCSGLYSISDNKKNEKSFNPMWHGRNANIYFSFEYITYQWKFIIPLCICAYCTLILREKRMLTYFLICHYFPLNCEKKNATLNSLVGIHQKVISVHTAHNQIQQWFFHGKGKTNLH